MRSRSLLVAPAFVVSMVSMCAAHAALGQARYQSTSAPRFAIDGSVDAAIPTARFAGMDLKTGLGFEGTARYRVMSRVSVYGGYDWSRMRLDRPTSSMDNVQGTGFVYGLRLDQPLMDRSSLWVRGGGLASQLRLSGTDGSELEHTQYGAGWEVGSGFNIGLGHGWDLTPSARFRSVNRNLVLNGTTQPGTLRYVTVGAGVQRKIW